MVQRSTPNSRRVGADDLEYPIHDRVDFSALGRVEPRVLLGASRGRDRGVQALLAHDVRISLAGFVPVGVGSRNDVLNALRRSWWGSQPQRKSVMRLD